MIEPSSAEEVLETEATKTTTTDPPELAEEKEAPTESAGDDNAEEPEIVDSSTALKAAKKILKQQEDKSMKLKALAKAIAEELQVDKNRIPSKELKHWIKENEKYTIDEQKIVTWVGKNKGAKATSTTVDPFYGGDHTAQVSFFEMPKTIKVATSEHKEVHKCPRGHFLSLLHTETGDDHDCRCDICYGSGMTEFWVCASCQGYAVCSSCKDKSHEPNPFLISTQHCDRGAELMALAEYAEAAAEFQKSLDIREGLLRKHEIPEIRLHCSLDAETMAKALHATGNVQGAVAKCASALIHLAASGFVASCPGILLEELETLTMVLDDYEYGSGTNGERSSTSLSLGQSATSASSRRSSLVEALPKELLQSAATSSDENEPVSVVRSSLIMRRVSSMQASQSMLQVPSGSMLGNVSESEDEEE